MARFTGDPNAPGCATLFLEHAEPAVPELAGSGLLEVAPPAFLDGLVKARAGDVLALRRSRTLRRSNTVHRAELEPSAPSGGRGKRAGPARGSAPRHIGAAEGWAYAFGFVAYGAQLADGLARLIWRALAG